MTEKLNLLGAVRNRIRVRHYRIRTEKSYVQSIKSYVHFNQSQHLRKLDVGEMVKKFRVRNFLRADLAYQYFTEHKHRFAIDQHSNDFRRIVSRML